MLGFNNGVFITVELKGKIYASCVRSCLIHGSQTWPMQWRRQDLVTARSTRN